jgi:hypothetical protein
MVQGGTARVRGQGTMIALEEQILSLLKKAPEQLMSFRAIDP